MVYTHDDPRHTLVWRSDGTNDEEQWSATIFTDKTIADDECRPLYDAPCNHQFFKQWTTMFQQQEQPQQLRG